MTLNYCGIVFNFYNEGMNKARDIINFYSFLDNLFFNNYEK